MSDMIQCDGCNREFSTRDLVTRSYVIESCRKCGHVIKQYDGFAGQDSAAVDADDISRIDEWLNSEVRRLPFVWQSSRPQRPAGDYTWSITGDAPVLRECPDGYCIGLAYNPNQPHVVAVRLTTIEPGEVDRSKVDSLISLLAIQGAQFWGEQRASYLPNSDNIETEWGVYQYLGTSMLDGLLSPVIGRLFGVMRETLGNQV